MSSGATAVMSLVRLAHPLPTLLNAAVAAALSTVAGARADQAALAAVTMLGVHACIGSLNDFFDRHRDAGRAEKPLASGTVPARSALVIAAVGVSCGLLAAAQLGSLALALAAQRRQAPQPVA